MLCMRLHVALSHDAVPLTGTTARMHACTDTFSTHMWKIKDEEGRLRLSYRGPSAQLEILEGGGASVVAKPPAAVAQIEQWLEDTHLEESGWHQEPEED